MTTYRRVTNGIRRRLRGTALDKVIAPEIKDDAFYRALTRVAATPHLGSILEIGASSGAGSTEALVAGIMANTTTPSLHCIEVSTERYLRLRHRYRDKPFVHCHNVSSVPLESFASESDVANFLSTADTSLRGTSLKVILGWRSQDMEYVAERMIATSGISMIKDSFGIDIFGAVLIDGSEFTGAAELKETYGARFVLLDDICTFKNYDNFRSLSSDPAYRVIEASTSPRNGYAIFERVS